jgi:hypothetical protein
MGKFVGRQRELTELSAVLAQGGAQFILVYGRAAGRFGDAGRRFKAYGGEIVGENRRVPGKRPVAGGRLRDRAR